jgi:Ca2+-transporting ATPase
MFHQGVAEALVKLNHDCYAAEYKTGHRAEVFDDYGGLPTLESVLRSDLDDGLSLAEEREDFAARRAEFGTNVMPQRKKRTLLSMIWEGCQDFVIIVLTIASIVSIILGTAYPERVYDARCLCYKTSSTGWVEGVAIIIAVLIVILVGALQDYDKERKFRALGKTDVRYIKVVRGGKPKELLVEDILAGDVVILDWGKAVPADGFLISADDMKVDEASVTGEAEPVKKDARDRWLLANTTVVAGSGKMIVSATGPRTEWGRTLLQLQEVDQEDTPLQEALGGMVVVIAKVGLLFGVMTFFILAIYWAIDTADLISFTTWHDEYVRGLIDAFIIGITLLVVGIPEGLPLAVMIALAYSVKAMIEDQCLVRHLQSCETMGGATNICSDKTGTLTQNRMTVMEGFIGFSYFESVPFQAGFAVEKRLWELIREGAALNSSSFRQEAKVIGYPTEMAILDMVDKQDGSADYYMSVRKDQAPNKLLQVPFSSETKRMISVFFVPAENVIRVHIKGAPDRLIADAGSVMLPDGKPVPVTEEAKGHLETMVTDLSNKGFRTLLLAYKDFAPRDFLRDPTAQSLQEKYAVDTQAPGFGSNLTVLCVVGIEDPVRPEVPAAVATCLRAGITVRMVTGDYAGTASKIAEQCGIKTAKGVVMTGAEFRALSDDQLDRVIPQLQVLARSQPSDKLRLVQRLKHLNQIVAVTGDGTNDAPALKEADVGLAMGIAGTDVAKEASDIIILDDNFKSIVLAVKWGRNVYEGVRKFLQFQLTVNVSALVLVFIGALTRQGAPLRAVQLLWINLIMDVMAALSLATEPPTDALLDQKPHGKTEPIISNKMWKHIVGQGVYQLVLTLSLLYAGENIPWTGGRLPNRSRQLYTIIFNSFVWAQLFNEFNCRTLVDDLNCFRGYLHSVYHPIIFCISAGLQAIIVELGGDAFKTAPLSWDQWLFCIAMGSGALLSGFLLRCIPVSEERQFLDILKFWVRLPKLRPITTEVVAVNGLDTELVTCKLYEEEVEKM